MEPGSSTVEDRDHPRQSRGVNPGIDDDAASLRNDDLHAPDRGSTAVGPSLGNDHRRHETGSQVRGPNPLGTKSPPPRVQQAGRNPVPTRRRRYQTRTAEALPNNPKLLVLGPAPSTAGLHNIETLNLITVRMTSHTHSRQPECLTPQGGLRRRDTLLHVAGFNLGILMRALFGCGTPRQAASARSALLFVIQTEGMMAIVMIATVDGETAMFVAVVTPDTE